MTRRHAPWRVVGRRVFAAVVLARIAGVSPVLPAPAATIAGPQTTVCPPAGRIVAAGAHLQDELNAATDGSTVCLSPGTYGGPISVLTPVTLVGPADAVIGSSGRETTVRVLAPRVTLQGFTIDGSGERFDTTDAAIAVRADDATVRGLTIRRALFGVVADRVHGIVVERNRIAGDPAVPPGLRGDAIRYWEVRGGRIAGNVIEDSRDVAVWYSPGTRLTGNVVIRSRYATHFMYSGESAVENNRYEDNFVGVFIMYSRAISVAGNLIAGNTSPEGMGLGAKESGDIAIERNRFLRDRQCLYIDNSPFGDRERMTIRGNTLAGCAAALTFHRSETRTAVEDNRFESNDAVTAIEGRGNARGVLWRGNYFDDYRGYDLDRDGYGDVPYALRDLSEQLIARHPAMALFRGTMAIGLMDLAADAFPVLRPETLLVDEHPRMSPPPAR